MIRRDPEKKPVVCYFCLSIVASDEATKYLGWEVVDRRGFLDMGFQYHSL